MNPFGAIAEFALGLIKRGEIQAWCRLIASILLSALITFCCLVGASIWYLYPQYGAIGAPVLAIANGLVGISVIVFALVKRSPLTKGIPIMVPGKIEAQTVDLLQKDGMEYVPNDKR